MLATCVPQEGRTQVRAGWAGSPRGTLTGTRGPRQRGVRGGEPCDLGSGFTLCSRHWQPHTRPRAEGGLHTGLRSAPAHQGPTRSQGECHPEARPRGLARRRGSGWSQDLQDKRARGVPSGERPPGSQAPATQKARDASTRVEGAGVRGVRRRRSPGTRAGPWGTSLQGKQEGPEGRGLRILPRARTQQEAPKPGEPVTLRTKAEVRLASRAGRLRP